MDKPLPPIDAATLVGLSCHLGTSKAIEFADYAESVGELEDVQKKLLLRGWLAVEHLPKDASLEASDLHKCLTALRQAWITIKIVSDEQAKMRDELVRQHTPIPNMRRYQ